MIRKQTTLLWIVALCLLGFIIIFEKPWKKEATVLVEQRSLLPSSQVSSWEQLVIQNDQAQLEFVRDDVTWNLTQPIQDIGHPTLISGLLESLSNLKPKTVLSQADIQKAGGWKTFGFEPATTTMTLSKGGNDVRIQLGDRESVGNQVYLRLNEEPFAWVVDASWLDGLPDQVEAWRDPRIVAADLGDMDHIEISHIDARIVMDKNSDGKGWHFTSPEALKDSRANITRIETLLSKSLPTLQVQEFLTEEEAGELKWLGLEDPVLELFIQQADKKPVHLSWGYNVPEKSGLRYAKLEGRSAIMVAPDVVFQEQLNVPPSAFRDPFLIDPAFSFNRLELGSKEPFTLFYDASQTKWKVEEPASLPTDPLLVRRLIQTLANIQVKAYHDSVNPELLETMFDVESYQMRFSTLIDQTESSPLTVQFSRSFDATMYAKRSDEKTIYELPASLLHDLPTHPVDIRNQDLWDVPVEEIRRIDIREANEEIRLDKSANGIWLLNGDILTETQKDFIKDFIEVMSHPKTSNWVDDGDAQYAQFGLDASGDGPQLTVHFERGASSVSKRILFGRQSPRSAIYAGVDLETGPVICELSNALTYNMRHILSWKKAVDQN
jgi:hypothetical protein